MNVSSVIIEDKFKKVLDDVCISEQIKTEVRLELNNLMAETQKEKEDMHLRFTKEVAELEAKLKKAKMRYATGEIDQDLYNMAKDELNTELELIRPKLWESETQLSNFTESIDEGLQLLENLSNLWASTTTEGKKRVQKAILNSALVYDRKNGDYRTIELNLFVRQNVEKSRGLNYPVNKNSQLLTGNSSLVGSTGEMSNQIWDDLAKIYEVAKKLGL